MRLVLQWNQPFAGVLGPGAAIDLDLYLCASDSLELNPFGAILGCDTANELAETLVRLIPCAERVAFSSTGSEATFYAMRIARAYTGRQKILKSEGAYHGNHDYSSFSLFPTRPAYYPVAPADSGGVISFSCRLTNTFSPEHSAMRPFGASISASSYPARSASTFASDEFT